MSRSDGPFNYDNGRPVSNWYSSGYRGIFPAGWYPGLLKYRYGKVLAQITPRLGYEYLQKFGFTTLVGGVEKNGKIFSGVHFRPWRYHIQCKKHRIKRLLCHHRKRRAVYQTQAVYDCKKITTATLFWITPAPRGTQVIKPSTAFLLTSPMQDVVTSGIGTACQLRRHVHRQ